MPLKAGVVQFCPVYGKTSDNLDSLETWIRQAADQSVELLTLPEMAWTGYIWPSRDTIFPLCEPFATGFGQKRLLSLSVELKMAIAFGFPEIEGSCFYNSQALALPDGRILGPYRKTHLFDLDYIWATPGNTGFQSWDAPIGRLGSGICMDLNFPDLVEFHRIHKTQVLLFSTNWLDEGLSVHRYWQDRLEGYRGYSLFANRGGEEYRIPYRGESAIFHGSEILVSMSGKEDGLLVADLDIDSLNLDLESLEA